MPEELFIKLIKTKKIHDVEAWIELSDEDFGVLVLHGEIRHTKNGPTHIYDFKYINNEWIKQ